jgi:hypothetical protein
MTNSGSKAQRMTRLLVTSSRIAPNPFQQCGQMEMGQPTQVNANHLPPA